ncbi:MAG TPA: TauD/TfdA family dioxygenase [Candidatus Cybelea sp.]|nr:TauD/TfdA family dioxygenase [Candidatus Cybelea sp.]
MPDAARYESIQVKPLAGALGAEVLGVDLSSDLGNQTFAEIHRAFLEHQVIFFRDQTLTPEQHKAFSARFGTLEVTRFVKAIEGHPEIIPVVKEPEDVGKFNFGGTWHSDMTFLPAPPLGSLLYALDVPAYGGDTLWANMYRAYETLSPGMRKMLDGLTAIHSATRAYGPRGAFARAGNQTRSMQIDPSEAAEEEQEHPVVRTHPETGRKCLFVNPVYTIRFKDMTERESKPLLDFLNEHAVQPHNTCRFRWGRGSLAFWDNRCTQHLALNDYDGQRRSMHRTTVMGSRPY